MDIALTLDYELFGNGSGDVFKHIIDPTEKLLAICDKKNIKLTIFFEVVEYWKLCECWKNGNTMGYTEDPTEAMKNQIINAFKNGHDIQLHIHPQWLNAKYIDDHWIVDNHWRMSDIPLDSKDELTLEEVIQKGKDTLEDSSVFAGGYENSNYAYLDFKALDPKIPYWSITDGDVLKQGNQFKDNKLIELPIFSLPYYRFMKYDFTRLKNFIFKSMSNRGAVIKKFNARTNKKSFLEKVVYFFEKEYITWDYCLFSYGKMKKFINKAKNVVDKNSDKYIPFITIGHAKDYVNSHAIDLLFSENEIHILTLRDIVRKIKLIENEKQYSNKF